MISWLRTKKAPSSGLDQITRMIKDCDYDDAYKLIYKAIDALISGCGAGAINKLIKSSVHGFEGSNICHVAVEHSKLSILQYIVGKCEVDPMVKNISDKTLLHTVIEKQFKGFVWDKIAIIKSLCKKVAQQILKKEPTSSKELRRYMDSTGITALTSFIKTLPEQGYNTKNKLQIIAYLIAGYTGNIEYITGKQDANNKSYARGALFCCGFSEDSSYGALEASKNFTTEEKKLITDAFSTGKLDPLNELIDKLKNVENNSVTVASITEKSVGKDGHNNNDCFHSSCSSNTSFHSVHSIVPNAILVNTVTKQLTVPGCTIL